MSGMQTTCPSCHAVFRVTPPQLEARGGKVRCGKCAFVFNAYDTLVTPIETVSLIPPPAEEEVELEWKPEWKPVVEERPERHAEKSPAEQVIEESVIEQDVVEEHITLQPAPPTVAEPFTETFTESFPLPTDEQIDREAEEINRRIAETEFPEVVRERKRRQEGPPTEPAARSKLEITPDLQEKLQGLQEELAINERRARWRTVGWSIGALILALVLAGQAAYFKRDWLAAHYPAAKPALEALCSVLQCRVSLLADAERIKLESSDLQTDPERANTVILTASLRNLAPYPQAYPYLELTLTDANNQPLARRQFAPRDYLPRQTRIEGGMPSNEEVAIKLPLELVGLNAVGYKLLVYYP
jgi:predicted Zn finger-like uncharacterized protein